MQGNSLVGNLPPEWGSAVAFPRLSKLYLGLNNSLTGELALVAFGGGRLWRLWPVDRQWAARCLEQCSCAWHSMQLFPTRAVLSSAGSLPESWGDDGAFPALTEL